MLNKKPVQIYREKVFINRLYDFFDMRGMDFIESKNSIILKFSNNLSIITDNYRIYTNQNYTSFCHFGKQICGFVDNKDFIVPYKILDYKYLDLKKFSNYNLICSTSIKKADEYFTNYYNEMDLKTDLLLLKNNFNI